MDLKDEEVLYKEDTSQDIEQILEQACKKEELLAVLWKLPKHYEATLLVKYMDNRSIKEIAQLVGKSPKAIERLLTRAKTQFIKEYTLTAREREDEG